MMLRLIFAVIWFIKEKKANLKQDPFEPLANICIKEGEKQTNEKINISHRLVWDAYYREDHQIK